MALRQEEGMKAMEPIFNKEGKLDPDFIRGLIYAIVEEGDEQGLNVISLIEDILAEIEESR